MAAVDVTIIGAGLSGLAAAHLLEARGLAVTVVEARDRVGGRTLSDRVGRATFDLGGQWIGPTQRRLHDLAATLGLTIFPTFHRGTKLLELGERRRSYRGAIPSLSLLRLVKLHGALRRLDRLTRAVDPAAPWASPRAHALDGISLEAWKRRQIDDPEVAALVDLALRSFLSAEPSEVSLLHLLAYIASAGSLRDLVEIPGGAQEGRFVEGAQTLAIRLRERLRGDLHLGAPVRAITVTGGQVRVTGDWGELRSARAILALPPHLCDRIAFTPDLPLARTQLQLHAPIGATIKVLVLYRAPFWRDDGRSGESLSTRGPYCFTIDNTSSDGAQPALVAFITGDMARRWGSAPAAARQAAVVDALARNFGPRARDYEAIVEHDWSADPWARGCPAGFLSPGVLATCGPALRAPLGPLHFAGTETARAWNGYLEGALEAAERVVAEIAG